jgi:hypothetical protein
MMGAGHQSNLSRSFSISARFFSACTPPALFSALTLAAADAWARY